MQQQKKVSYIRKPFARRSFMALGLAVAAVCFCSFLIAIVSLIYGALSFFEKEKKYILSKIGMAVSGFLVIVWAVLIIIGFGG